MMPFISKQKSMDEILIKKKRILRKQDYKQAKNLKILLKRKTCMSQRHKQFVLKELLS